MICQPEVASAPLPIEIEADFARVQFALNAGASVLVVAALLLQVVSDKGGFHWLATFLLVLGAGGSLALRAHQAKTNQVLPIATLGLGVGVTLIALVTLLYAGPFTAAAVVLSPICYTYGFARVSTRGWLVVATATLGFFCIALAALLGAFDPAAGPIGVHATQPRLAVFAIATVTEIVLFTSYVLGRRNRELVNDCFDRLRTANQELTRRADELEQARWDLDHVIELAQVGHLTGTRMGDYRMGELIGRGGMGEVYRAWSSDGGRPVALKVLTPSMSENPAVVERFFREARVSSSLASPHIVDVLDSGWADGGYPFLAMELLRGRDLAVHLAEHGRLTPSAVVELVTHIASALGVAHEVGIVHRDIKPANIFSAHGPEGNRWVVLDFGVSKVKGGTGTLTQGGLVGTPRYMAPEQARGMDVDARADVFSLGAIVYRCLTGRAAFDADDPLCALVQVLGEQPIRPGAIADVPHDVELVLALALAKDASQRVASVGDFARALRDAFVGALDNRYRRDAAALLARAPWSEDGEAATVRPGSVHPGAIDAGREYGAAHGYAEVESHGVAPRDAGALHGLRSSDAHASGRPVSSGNDWVRESGDRPQTSALPYLPTVAGAAPPPPFRESEDSVTALAAC